MDLQAYLVNKFATWHPPPPLVTGRTKRDVTLSWSTEPFDFLEGDLLFWVQKKEKMPPWVVVYSGGKTSKTIDNLAPRHPHKFRIKVILKATAVQTLAKRALEHFGNESTVYEHIEVFNDTNKETKKNSANNENTKTSENNTIPEKNLNIETNKPQINLRGNGDVSGHVNDKKEEIEFRINNNDAAGDVCNQENTQISSQIETSSKKWLESQWSEETSTSTDTDGTSVICFCMAVRCGYLKQVQAMLEERPDLIEIVNSTNGFTPLATAVRKGDINTVKFLLTAGANVNQPSSSGQTPLHLATLEARVALVDLLMDNGADLQARDLNGLRVEHYAVDAGSPEMLTHILQRGGDLTVKDNNGWTPLFRAVTQGASTELIELLVLSGSDVTTADYAGLGLPSAARLLHNRHGRDRDSILRLIDSQYPHEQAVANFTRLTKKISSLHTMLK
ncbi:putative ankyrin repeat protein RF_0381 [Cydia pomonella]|uniref:putative ankyrin repeat protein RF_0381 n=1 Tax=Cydia pomonella TaxID=82600 RepID=UPI002ADE13AB|nr:putative ankyrin repeat protein RF_0381 [Cydia pomonella]